FAQDWPTDPIAGEGHPGQWRLARVDVANWGTFCGYHSLPVDRKGLLITGASGSGKSSLLDAITTVLTPPRNRHLNAAARNGSSKGEDRTPVSYLRGAWRHETNEIGEVTCSYLRPNTAIWSGILLRYENGLDGCAVSPDHPSRVTDPVNLLLLFNLKAGCNTDDGIAQLYAVISGEHTLDEFEPYAINGVDFRKFKSAFPTCKQVFREHSAFAASLCRHLGIAGPKTLELLHKTQAAKNFGSLDDLFRNFMLDEPKTFAHAKEAVEQFTALSQAHAGVVEQRKQMQHLEPLVALDAQNQTAQHDAEQMQALADALPGYTGQLALDFLQTERDSLQKATDQLTEQLHHAETEQKFARQEFEQAQKSLVDAGGDALNLAESQMLDYQRQRNQVQENRSRLLLDLECARIDEIPRTYTAWQELGRSITKKADAAQAEQEESRDSQYQSYGRVPDLQKSIRATEDELRHLHSRETNIPKRLHQVRMDIASHLGIPPQELPFVGELLSVKPACAAWRGAIERLLENRAKTLLVTARNIKTVSQFVESRHLGLRLEFISVPLEIEVPKRSLGEKSLIRKLVVKQHLGHPEYSNWINQHLRDRFDYICVDTPDELENHRFALTIGGQIKRENRYVKDDRHALDDPTKWVLGDDNEEKSERYAKQLKQLKLDLAQAEKTAKALDEQTRRSDELQRANTILKQCNWESYDIARTEDEEKRAIDFYELLKKGSSELTKATAWRDETKKRCCAADESVNECRLDVASNQRRLAENAQEIAQHTKRSASLPRHTAEEATKLFELFKRSDAKFNASVPDIFRVSTEVTGRVGALKTEALGIVQKTRNRIERIMHEYRQEWPLQSADLTESYADKEAYLGIYHQIKASGLPDYEQRFLHVLHDFSQDQITVIASTLRNAFREVKEKLIPVNRSLKLSPYSTTTHLQIRAKDNKTTQVSEFLDALKEITQGTWDEKDIASAEARFEKTNAVIKRLKSSESADRAWRKACLDTRQHVSFIANEIDADGSVVNVHSSDTGLSGGQKQKLVIFCLAAALRYQLADEDQPIPRYGTVVLDEAFDKADPAFARTAMDIFKVFGFHMVLATPYKLISLLSPYLGAIAAAHCRDSKYSSLTLVDFAECPDDDDDDDDEEESHGD
ncbi:MAG: SbcC/MukB-like Walker B domain-containing protein, partial [Raoultibacter sp.]